MGSKEKNLLMKNQKMGPPFIEIDIVEVERLASLGLSQTQICHCLGIDPCTLINRKKENQLVQLALTRGKAKGIAKVAGKLMEKAEMRSEGSIFFYLKTQAKDEFSEKQQVETTNTNLNLNADQQDLSPTDSDLIARAVKRLMREE